MTRIQQLPRIVMTWGLMLLTVIAGGVRPSCICADGTLCVFCPKLIASHASLPSTEPSATIGPCLSKSCCCGHAAVPTQSESTTVCEWTGSTCDGCDCLASQSAAPATVQTVEDPVSRLDRDVVPALLANAELALSRESFRSMKGTHRVGPPPDLIVLFQRWLI